MTNPLSILPPEIILRIIDFIPTVGIANLTLVSKSWHDFIDHAHQDLIFSSKSKTDHPNPNGKVDFSFLSDYYKCITKHFKGVDSWKELCRRQTLLRRNWKSSQPQIKEGLLQVSGPWIWRFRVDFKRNFVVATAVTEGLTVKDLDTGALLWEYDDVRPYAHLEYDMNTGIACWDRYGDSIEIWKAVESPADRGKFRLVTVLHHDVETRGFQLSHNTLCVVSTEGEAFIYDMTVSPPALRLKPKIQNEAIGHLDQTEDIVMYAFGLKGYDLHSKQTGGYLGNIHPKNCIKNIFHIDNHVSSVPMDESTHKKLLYEFRFWEPNTQILKPLSISRGPDPKKRTMLTLEEDEWGAGVISGTRIVAVSKAGRIFICSDWQLALKSSENFAATTALIEVNYLYSSMGDLGEWLSVRDDKISFALPDNLFLITGFDVFNPQSAGGNNADLCPIRGDEKVWTLRKSSIHRANTTVSFIALWDDCLMYTYAVSLPYDDHQRNSSYFSFPLTSNKTQQAFGTVSEHTIPAEEVHNLTYSRPHLRPDSFLTKVIRVISFAPNV